MNAIASQKMSRGQGNELLNKLEAAGLNDALTQKVIDSKGNDLADKLVKLIQNPSYKPPVRSWREEDGVIYFSVESDGTTGEDWITRLKSKGFRVSDYANKVLRSMDFKPTNGVTTEVAVLRGCLFEDDDRITKKICAEADKRKFSKPNVEVSCLIREKFTDQEIEAMGLWYIFAMHEPLSDSGGGPSLLGAGRGDGGCGLGVYVGGPDGGWTRGSGFAFALSQVSSQF